MSLYDRMLNINNLNIDEEIKMAIASVKNQLDGLTFERTCLVYASYIYNELKDRHLNVNFMSTEDINDAYIHYFNIVNSSIGKYLIDLNYKQFNNDEYPDLLDNGYQLVNEEEFNHYLEIVSQKKKLDSFFNDTPNNLGR